MNGYVQKIKGEKPFFKFDLIIVVFALILCLLPLLSLFFKTKGDTVVITYDKQTTTYSLDENATITLKNGKIVVEINCGEVKVISSDCENGICVHSRPISEVGESIVCIPNSLVVKITGDGFDASTGGGV